MRHEQGIRRAAYLILAGLGVHLLSATHWAPIPFLLFMGVGVPLVLAGVYLYLSTVWRILKERKAL